MAGTPLDLTPLSKAIGQLRQSSDFAEAAYARSDLRLASVLRTAVVQAFAFTFEICVKMLRRYLELAESNPAEIHVYSFNRLLRLAYEREITRDELAVWINFRELRNTTSHAYNADIAEKVYKAARRLLAEPEDLHSVLQRLVPYLT